MSQIFETYLHTEKMLFVAERYKSEKVVVIDYGIFWHILLWLTLVVFVTLLGVNSGNFWHISHLTALPTEPPVCWVNKKQLCDFPFFQRTCKVTFDEQKTGLG